MTYRLLFTLLKNSQAITTLVGSNVFAEHAPTGAVGACIVFRSLGGTINDHLANESDCAQRLMQVDFYHETLEQAEYGYNALRNLLSGYGPAEVSVMYAGQLQTVHVSTINLVRHGMLIDEPRDGSDKWSYRFSADFEIFHSQAVPTHT